MPLKGKKNNCYEKQKNYIFSEEVEPQKEENSIFKTIRFTENSNKRKK